MGHRQLALVFSIGSALLALGIAAIRMMLGWNQFGVGVAATAVLFILSSLIQMLIARKKWELDYKNAFIMLMSTSVLGSFIYAFGYRYVENAFPEMMVDGHFQFWPLFFVNVVFRIPVDAIVAIFRKR